MTTQIVAFSGGNDSTALALLMPDAQPIFTDTGWEFPDLYAHIARFEDVTGRAVLRLVHPEFPGGLPEYIKAKRFMPNHGARFCTRMFKIEVLNRWIAAQSEPIEMNIALRADEPADVRVGNLTDMEGLAIRYPLREWGMTRLDVLKTNIEHGLLARYPVYMARGGCIGCFYKRKSEVRAMLELTPAVYDELQELEESVQDERGKYFHMFSSLGKSLAEFRMQTTMFDPSEVYVEAGADEDKGAACGLFCHR